MKKFLISTDFSANASHAAAYGYALAKRVRADVILCNAVIEPAEVPQAGLVSWPLVESEYLLKASTDELGQLSMQLQRAHSGPGYQPAIGLSNEPGPVTEVVNELAAKEEIGLVVIGTHGASGLTSFLLGNHSREMIDAATRPLLLVPPSARITPIKKIAFATDFKNPEDDLACIYELIGLAKPMHAEILLTHIYDDKGHTQEFETWIKRFLIELSNTADYPNIYYRVLTNDHVLSGLEWLCVNGQIDILAMVHRSHTFIDSLFRGSQTQKMAGRIPVPLLVFPQKN